MRHSNTRAMCILAIGFLFMACSQSRMAENKGSIGSVNQVLFKLESDVHINSQTAISVTAKDPNDVVDVFLWETDAGTIEGSKTNAILNTPLLPGTIHIKVSYHLSGKSSETFSADAFIPVSGQLVILKADDMVYYPTTAVSPGFQLLCDVINDHKIKGSIGIIANSLECEDARYYDAIKNMNEKGNIEFWNHGYDHSHSPDASSFEFQNRPFQDQLDHLDKAQTLAVAKLGFPFRAFGAPYNKIDQATVLALKARPDLTIWLYGSPGAGKYLLSQSTVEIEKATGVPDFDHFLTTYNDQEELMVIQFHPSAWGLHQRDEFLRIIDFLISKKVVFLTPSEYIKLSTQAAKASVSPK